MNFRSSTFRKCGIKASFEKYLNSDSVEMRSEKWELNFNALSNFFLYLCKKRTCNFKFKIENLLVLAKGHVEMEKFEKYEDEWHNIEIYFSYFYELFQQKYGCVLRKCCCAIWKFNIKKYLSFSCKILSPNPSHNLNLNLPRENQQFIYFCYSCTKLN